VAAELAQARTLRRDRWWIEPLPTIVLLGGFIVYSTWAALVNTDFTSGPYISPFYSPCLVAACGEHAPFRLFGAWYTLTPALLILWAPLGFRATCYYYRKAYYRSFFGSPPACAVRDLAKRYSGETRFPFILQNLHRYFFWAVMPVLFFLWWDAVRAFSFDDGIGVGVGTIVLILNASLLSLYSLSCHSCRHLVGGTLDVFSRHPVRYRMWRLVSRFNARHAAIAWVSLVWVAWTDLYVRLLANGVFRDLRIF
jgi:hypothetical protein